MKRNRFAFPLWSVAPLLAWVQKHFGVSREVAFSMLVSHAKACRMNVSQKGWPYRATILANSRTDMRDLVDFAWALGLRAQWGSVPR